MVECLQDYRYVVSDIDRHGNQRFYFRRRGQKKVRLRGTPGTAEFEAEYRAAQQRFSHVQDKPKEKSPAEYTLSWLSDRYARSAEFKSLDPQTQNTRYGILQRCWEERLPPGAPTLLGECPLDQATPRLVRMLRDRKARFPHAANSRVKCVRRLFKWAVEYEYIDINPAQSVPYLPTPPGGYHALTDDEIAQYESHWEIGTRQRLAFALLRYLGVRRSDVVCLGSPHLRDGWFTFTVKKGERRAPVTLELPVPSKLQQIIEQTPCHSDETFLVTEWGRPFTAAGFGMRFRDWCNQAGLPHCTAHGLRKAAARSLAEAGATPYQLMSWFGWRSLKEAERYTRAASQRKLAASVLPLLDRQAVQEVSRNA